MCTARAWRRRRVGAAGRPPVDEIATFSTDAPLSRGSLDGTTTFSTGFAGGSGMDKKEPQVDWLPFLGYRAGGVRTGLESCSFVQEAAVEGRIGPESRGSVRGSPSAPYAPRFSGFSGHRSSGTNWPSLRSSSPSTQISPPPCSGRWLHTRSQCTAEWLPL